METFKKILGAVLVLVGIGDIIYDKSWFWGSVIIVIGLSLLIKKWGDIMFRKWGKQ